VVPDGLVGGAVTDGALGVPRVGEAASEPDGAAGEPDGAGPTCTQAAASSATRVMDRMRAIGWTSIGLLFVPPER